MSEYNAYKLIRVPGPPTSFVALLKERFPSYWGQTTSPIISTMIEESRSDRPYGCYVQPTNVPSAAGAQPSGAQNEEAPGWVEIQTRWNSWVGCDSCGMGYMGDIFPVCKARPRIPGNWYHGRCATKGFPSLLFDRGEEGG